MKLIGILGRLRVGKDTTGDYLVNEHNYTKLAFATPLKEGCKILFNLNDYDVYEGKDVMHPYWGVTPRTLIKYIANDVFRSDINRILPNVGDKFWVNHTMNKCKELDGVNIVISDVRFQSEIDAIHNNGGIIIKVVNNNVNKMADEDHIDELLGDYYVINEGSLDELYEKIEQILNDLD